MAHAVPLAAEAGTQGYEPDTKRRLKILNISFFFIARPPIGPASIAAQ